MFRFLKWLGALIVVLVIAGALLLYFAPPELIRVGANYTAKMVCSNAFMTQRDPQDVLEIDVQAPGHPLLTIMQIDVDREAKHVKAGLFGMFGNGLAIYREGYGCTAVPDGDLIKVTQLQPVAPSKDNNTNQIWPDGDTINFAPNEKLDAILNNEDLAGQGMRAIVVVKDGKIVGQRFAEGFDKETPLLGWSMTKTVTAALVGRLMKLGTIGEDPDNLFAGWANDNRKNIKLSDLLSMSSDLEWNEGYGSVSDVTRLLFLEPDAKTFAASSKLTTQDGSQIGKQFNYSSGTSVLISAYWQSLFSNPQEARAFPRKELFDRLGMTSAVMEVDARGTFVGGSYMYATAYDWARLGQFLLQKGTWKGEQLLLDGYTDWMITPHPASEGKYANGHIWRAEPNYKRVEKGNEFKQNAYWLAGHDGQSVGILPDDNLVIVRLGLTPSKTKYFPANLAKAVSAALK